MSHRTHKSHKTHFLQLFTTMPNHTNRPWRDTLLAFLMLLPAAVPLLVFSLYPISAVFFGSFFDGVGPGKLRFAGMLNYDRVLGGEAFWESLVITVFYVLGTLPFALGIAFVIAALLHQQIVGRGMYRTAYFLPYITSTVAAAIVFTWIFGISDRSLANLLFASLDLPQQRWVQEPRGILELIAHHFGVRAYPQWAGGPSLALLCVMVFSVWHMLGFNIVVFLAGLSAIPKEIYEAAEVDGAGWWQRTRHVTLPLLAPTWFFLGIVSTIRAFQSFNDIYIITPTERLNSTRNLVMLIVAKMREGGDYGYAMAVSCLLFFMILGLTLAQMRLFERKVHYQ